MFKTIIAAVVAVGFSSVAYAHEDHAKTTTTTPAEATITDTAGTPAETTPGTGEKMGKKADKMAGKMHSKMKGMKKAHSTTPTEEKKEEPKM